MVFSVIYLGFAASSDLDDAIYRADLDASGCIMKTNAIDTGSLINDIEIITRTDCVYRTFRLACSAIGALFGNSVCHCSSSYFIMENSFRLSARESLCQFAS